MIQAQYKGLLFILLAMIQIGVPAWMILDHQRTLDQGELFLFETIPVDPVDYLRGRYVALNFAENEVVVEKKEKDSEIPFQQGDEVFITLEVDDEGFTHFSGILEQQPDASQSYIKQTLGYTKMSTDDTIIYHLALPFDRYYMDEFKAPLAEHIVDSVLQKTDEKVWAAVRVYQGNAVLEDVIVGHQTLLEKIQQTK